MKIKKLFYQYNNHFGLLLFVFCAISFSNNLLGQEVVHKFGTTGGPAGNGYNQTNQSATFTNISKGALSPYSATYSVSNQQFSGYRGATTTPALGFGGEAKGGNGLPTSVAVYSPFSTQQVSTPTYYTATKNSTTGTGMVMTDRGIVTFNVAVALMNNNVNAYPLNSKVYFGDVTITFNKPVTNPVLHVSGFGSWYYVNFGQDFVMGMSQQIELTNNYSLTRLSGSPYFALDSGTKTIYNSAQYFGTITEGMCINGFPHYGASGSVVVNGTGITSLTFKIYMKGDGAIHTFGVGDGTYTGNDSSGTCTPPGNIRVGGNNATWSQNGYLLGDTVNMSVSFATVRTTGTIFNDVNGLPIDNGGLPTNTIPSGIYANLIDSDGKVLESVSVATDGTYTLTEAMEGSSYRVQLSNSVQTVGAIAPTSFTPPTGWSYVGSSTLPSDTVGSSANFTALSGGNPNINFGIQRRPETAISTGNENLPPSGSSFAIPGSYFSTSTNPSNPNTSDYDGGTVTSIRITTFPTNASSITIGGTTYTSATFPTGGVTTPYNSGNPDVSIAPSGAAGSVSTINFVAIDNAGSEDSTPGSIAITWNENPCKVDGLVPTVN